MADGMDNVVRGYLARRMKNEQLREKILEDLDVDEGDPREEPIHGALQSPQKWKVIDKQRVMPGEGDAEQAEGAIVRTLDLDAFDQEGVVTGTVVTDPEDTEVTSWGVEGNGPLGQPGDAPDEADADEV